MKNNIVLILICYIFLLFDCSNFNCVKEDLPAKDDLLDFDPDKIGKINNATDEEIESMSIIKISRNGTGEGIVDASFGWETSTSTHYYYNGDWTSYWYNGSYPCDGGVYVLRKGNGENNFYLINCIRRVEDINGSYVGCEFNYSCKKYYVSNKWIAYEDTDNDFPDIKDYCEKRKGKIYERLPNFLKF